MYKSAQVFHRHRKSDNWTTDVFLVWIQSNTSSVFSYIVHLLMVRISDIPKSHLLYEWLKVKFILKMTLQLWDSRSLSIKRATEKSPLLSFSYVKLIFYKCIFTVLIKVMLQRFLESAFQKYDWFWLGNMTRRILLQQAKVFQIPPLTIPFINCTKFNKNECFAVKAKGITWINLATSSPTETKLTNVLVLF